MPFGNSIFNSRHKGNIVNNFFHIFSRYRAFSPSLARASRPSAVFESRRNEPACVSAQLSVAKTGARLRRGGRHRTSNISTFKYTDKILWMSAMLMKRPRPSLFSYSYLFHACEYVHALLPWLNDYLPHLPLYPMPNLDACAIGSDDHVPDDPLPAGVILRLRARAASKKRFHYTVRAPSRSERRSMSAQGLRGSDQAETQPVAPEGQKLAS